MTSFEIANFRRAAAAGISNAFHAGQALHQLEDVPERWRLVAEARIADPVASWTEIGERVGMTKHQAAGIYRRLIRRARGQLELRN